MSKRELGKVEVLARVKSGDLRVVDAAALLRVSYRQAKRLWKRYREEGAAGMKHRSAGRRSNRAYAESLRQKVLRRVREKYGGEVGERFGPTLAAEHLASENGLQVDAETLRRWMLGEGLWSRERRRRRHRRRRRRWPCPPLRPKRSALRAPQGFAPGKVNDKEKTKKRAKL
jgi:transposase